MRVMLSTEHIRYAATRVANPAPSVPNRQRAPAAEDDDATPLVTVRR